MRPLILRSQDALLSELKEEVGIGGSGGLWSDSNIYRALNRAVRKWAGKVVLPRLYSVSGGFTSSSWSYSLPRYIRGDIDVEIYRSNTWNQNAESDTTGTWTTVFAGTIEPSDENGETAVFRFHTAPYTQSGRIKWWVENGPIPTNSTDLPLLSSGITDSDVTLVIDQTPTIGDNGWVKVDGEYISYAGVTRGATTISLLNCERGLWGSTAAAHDAADTVYWCVAADDERLWEQLTHQTLANLHESKLHRGTVQDRRAHQEMVNYEQERADRFWTMNGYVTQRRPRMELSQQALGALPWS